MGMREVVGEPAVDGARLEHQRVPREQLRRWRAIGFLKRSVVALGTHLTATISPDSPARRVASTRLRHALANRSHFERVFMQMLTEASDVSGAHCAPERRKRQEMLTWRGAAA